MAGLSRSQYLRAKKQEETSLAKLLVKIVFSAIVIVVLPQVIFVAMGLYIVLAIMFRSVKMAIDLPDYR